MRHIICLFILHLFAFSLYAADTTYSRQWKDIDTTVFNRSLTRTALTKVNSLYQRAKKDNNQPQVIKTLLYRMYLEQGIKESNMEADVMLLQKELEETKDVAARSILLNIIARKYQQYHDYNRYRIYNRTNTGTFKEEDMSTWTIEDLHKTITHYYLLSLEPKQPLQQQLVKRYDAILNDYNAALYRPTLFDLLAHQALEYFNQENTYLTRPNYAFIIDQPAALGNAATFINQGFTTRDTASNHFKALLIYQDIIRFHLQQKDIAALVHNDLARLQFVRQHAVVANKDSLYYAAVLSIANQYKQNRHATEAFYLLANYHAEQAVRYTQQKDSAARLEYVNALSIIQHFIPVQDSTIGHQQLYNLYQNIINKSLRLQAEEVNVPEKTFNLLVNFKNIDTLYYRIIRATSSLKDTLEKYPANDWAGAKKTLYKIARNLPFIAASRVAMPNTKDYQEHAVEVKIDQLAIGEYYLLASASPSFSDTVQLAWQHLVVSNISFARNAQNLFVLNRTTGQPLAGAMVQVYESQYNSTSRSYKPIKKESYTADKNGYVKIKVDKDGRRNMQVAAIYRGDSLYSNPSMYIQRLMYHSNDDNKDYEDDAAYEENNARIFYFTDRSIYRPGQKVHLKMIVLTRDRKTGASKLYFPGDELKYIFLQDANRKKVDSLPVKLNAFGSFAGAFTLPATGLTGEFSFENNNAINETGGEFSVEEYKRPTFEVSLAKPAGEYKLTDTFTITGIAKAYAGNAADGAMVKFSVTRRGRFMYPWLYRGFLPRSEEAAITHGEARTDAEGKFTIRFALLPDEKVDRKTLPVFDFEIAADVTNNTGETRSNKLVVSAGYHSLNVPLNVKETEEADSLKHIIVNTTNIGGDKVPATVTVSILPLQAPKELLRKKYWHQPDTSIYSREQYKQWFPNDEWGNEADKATWQRGSAVLNKTINSSDSNKVTIPPGVLQPGWYVVQAKAMDKQGNEIKDEKYIQLYSQEKGGIAGGNYFFTSTIKNVVPPGEAANFLLGSSAADDFIIQEVQQKPVKKQKDVQVTYSFHTIDKNLKTVQVKPAGEDESLTVNFIMVKDNRLYTWRQQVFIQHVQQTVNVEVNRYRNKLEPGANETWTVKISGEGKDAIAAEVLTSMYDASLDQFKPHNWTTPALHHQTFNGNIWYDNDGFRTRHAIHNYVVTKQKHTSLIYPRIQLNFDAFRGSRRREMGSDLSVQLQGRAAGVENASIERMDEIVVAGYGAEKRQSLTGATSSIKLRGSSTITSANNPLVIVDGKEVSGIDAINSDDILNTSVLQAAEAIVIYGARAANGVIIITTKGGAEKEKADAPVKLRTNFNETAFFFPQLRTDEQGNMSFSFTLPEAVTTWKWQVLAHTKQAGFAKLERSIISQKTLMVQTNAPRFLRQGDQIELSARISNLGDNEMKGTATLQLVDATTGEVIDQILSNTSAVKNFTVVAKQTNAIKFSIKVPASVTNPVTWRVVAKAANYSDGEENTIPVLSNRMLVTETVPFMVRGGGPKTFEMTKLLNHQSKTLQHHALTIEYTAEPVWYAIQSLPYLVDYPYECSEQIFNRLFANALAAKIADNHPRIKQVFDQWMKIDSVTGQPAGNALLNLQRNQELKNILLQETPWVLQAQSEAQQQKNLGVLFDVMRMSKSFATNIQKLKQVQMESGGFPWFKGGYEDRYITQYILTGIGRLKKMNAIPAAINRDLETISHRAIEYLDDLNNKSYAKLERDKVNLDKQVISNIDIQYLYMRSMFSKDTHPLQNNKALTFYTTQARQQWNKQTHYFKAMIGAALYQAGERTFVTQNILPALLENAVVDSDSAMYWKDMQRGYYWYEAPVEQQALMMELVNDVYKDNKSAVLLSNINDMKTWLLKQKQTNHWSNTRSTADACYALVLTGTNTLSQQKQTTITVGDHTINTTKAVAGAGYIKERITAHDVKPAMGKVVVTTTGANLSTTPSWGAVYWQYFEEMEKITRAATPLSIEKKFFIEVNTANGKELKPVTNGDALNIGDKLKVRIILRSDRNMEYIHLKDMRAAGSEPVNVLSGYKWQDGLGYYESTRDAATNFFIDRLPRGTYVFEYPLFISHSGNFSAGIATVQCMYAPEFSSHSEGIRVSVK